MTYHMFVHLAEELVALNESSPEQRRAARIGLLKLMVAGFLGVPIWWIGKDKRVILGRIVAPPDSLLSHLASARIVHDKAASLLAANRRRQA